MDGDNLEELIGRPEWMHTGACHGFPEHIFFPARGASTAPAKAICAICNHRQQCRDHALTQPEKFGIWGGLSEYERRRMRPRNRQAHQ